MINLGQPSHHSICRRQGSASRLAALLAVAFFGLRFLVWFSNGVPLGHTIPVTDLTADAGLSYTGRLKDSGQSERRDDALLYIVEIRAGGPLHFLQGVLADSYAFGRIEALLGYRIAAHPYEQWVRQGPGSSLLDDIRQKGNGRYAIQGDRINFSLPEGTAIAGVQRLEVVVPFFPPGTLGVATRLLHLALIVASAGLLLTLLRPALRRFRRRGAVSEFLLSAGVIATSALIAAAGIAEIYFRTTGRFPRSTTLLPVKFVPDVGFLYEPNAEIRWTNGLDFWTVQYTNSLGFADREPATPKPPGTFRILLVGDSFVEALQVPAEQKLQTLLADSLRRHSPGQSYDVVAMGHVGTGQANQFPFIEQFGRRIEPDLVILLFIENDFVNNSPILESVRRGWNPNYLPSLYFRLDEQGNCQRLPISPDYLKWRLPVAPVAEHVAMLRDISPADAAKLDGWDPETQPMDDMFFSDGNLPPAFEEAVALTKCAFAAWQARAENDGFRLIAVAADDVTDGAGTPRPGAFRRLKTITRELNIPLLDLYPRFATLGGTARARWAHDTHWNATGYRWASTAIAQFLDLGGYLQRRTRDDR
jgi:hypothetical protein